MARKLWTDEEDRLLRRETATKGADDSAWADIAALMKQFGYKKTAKQCRERWMNHINPELLRSEWRPEDNKRLLDLHEKTGSHWKNIAVHFPGRTDNSIKNQFFSLVRKSLRKARKSVSKNANTAEVNAIKPKVLSNILSQNLDIPKDVIPSGPLIPSELTFLSHTPIQLKEFVSCFAFSKITDQAVQSNAEVTNAVDYVLRCLENQNKEYIGNKSGQRSRANPRARIRKAKTTSSISNSRRKPEVFTPKRRPPLAKEPADTPEQPGDPPPEPLINEPSPAVSHHEEEQDLPRLYLRDSVNDDPNYTPNQALFNFRPRNLLMRRPEAPNSSSNYNNFEWSEKDPDPTKQPPSYDPFGSYS